jgi:hypothetical protein
MNTILRKLALTLALASALGALSAQPAPSFRRSLDVDLMGAWSYRQTLGLSSSEAKLSYAPMITYSFLLDERNALGIVLLKFNHFALAQDPVYTFAYGFQFKHYWNRAWADLGPFIPWLSYGILLNQAVVTGTPGRAIGHNTRIGLGSDLVVAPAHHLVVQGAWDSVDYPSLGVSSANGLSTLSFGVGYRFLF